MSQTLAGALQKGLTFRDLLLRMSKLHEAGKPLALQVEGRSVPYLDHTLVSWTDGPPSSTVAFVLSGQAADGHSWRRFTLSRVGPWRYELECFPTAFHNGEDPLAPGMPPSQSRHA